MSCARGAASPDAHTQRRLFAASGGYCQNPSCSNELFLDIAGKSIHIAEMAHIFAASDDGPRAKSSLSKSDRGAFENLLMLCSNCHTKVDKAPNAYPDSMMLRWKRDHANKLQALFGAVRFNSRSEARLAVENLFFENRLIFEKYGPYIDAAQNPESGAAEQWKRKLLSKLLPNSRKILSVINLNRQLLRADEEQVFEQFNQHIDDLEAVHIEGKKEDATQFPSSVALILKD